MFASRVTKTVQTPSDPQYDVVIQRDRQIGAMNNLAEVMERVARTMENIGRTIGGIFTGDRPAAPDVIRQLQRIFGGASAGGGTIHVHVNIDGRQAAQAIVPRMPSFLGRQGLA